MPRDFPQSQAELEAQLAEQFDHIQASSNRFDKGVASEAKRLALAVRILAHDRGQSRSLLGQLGRKDIKFWDSAVSYGPSNLADQWGLLVMTAGGDVPTFLAPLDNRRAGAGRWIEFEEWWEGAIFRDSERRQMTRAGLILAVADQDGGAHVDPALEAAYAALSRQNSLGWMKTHSDGRQELADPPHLEAVRQIAHEVLKTLVPAYAKERAPPRNTAFESGLELWQASPRGGSRAPAPAPRPRSRQERPMPLRLWEEVQKVPWWSREKTVGVHWRARH